MSVRAQFPGDPEMLRAMAVGNDDFPGFLHEYAYYGAGQGISPEETARRLLADLGCVCPVDATTVRRICYRAFANMRGLAAEIELDPRAHEASLRRRLQAEADWPGARFGIDGLDRATGGFYPGDLVVITAGPGSGKTSLALNLTEKALVDGLRVLFASIDMGTEALAMRRLQRRLCWPEWRVRAAIQGGGSEEDLRALAAAERDVRELDDGRFCLIGRDEAGNCTDDQVLAAAMRVCPDVVVVDYATLLRGPKDRSDLEVVSRIVPRFLVAAERLGFVAILLSQMGRAARAEQVAGSTGGHGRGGGALEERAHFEIELQKFHEAGKSRYFATVAKNRRGTNPTMELDLMTPGLAFSAEATQVYRAKPQRSPFEASL